MQVLRGIDISLAKTRRTFSDVQIDGLAEAYHDSEYGRVLCNALHPVIVCSQSSRSCEKSHGAEAVNAITWQHASCAVGADLPSTSWLLFRNRLAKKMEVFRTLSHLLSAVSKFHDLAQIQKHSHNMYIHRLCAHILAGFSCKLRLANCGFCICAMKRSYPKMPQTAESHCRS